MDAEEYKAIRTVLRGKASFYKSTFNNLFDISRDIDGNYSSGRTAIPDKLGRALRCEMENKKRVVEKLLDKLKLIFLDTKGFRVDLDTETYDVKVYLNDDLCIHFKNAGYGPLIKVQYLIDTGRYAGPIVFADTTQPAVLVEGDLDDMDWFFCNPNRCNVLDIPDRYELSWEFFTKTLQEVSDVSLRYARQLQSVK